MLKLWLWAAKGLLLLQTLTLRTQTTILLIFLVQGLRWTSNLSMWTGLIIFEIAGESNCGKSLSLTLLWRRSFSYRNQSIGLQSKSMDSFLYEMDLRHERVKWEQYCIFITCNYGVTTCWWGDITVYSSQDQ